MNPTSLARLSGRVAIGAVLAGLMLCPSIAEASSSSGMPWSSGMNQLSTEARGGLAFAFIVMGCVGGFAEYMNNGQLSMLLMLLARAGIVIGALGGLVTLASLFGMTAAVI